jgi:hypothetical protein
MIKKIVLSVIAMGFAAALAGASDPSSKSTPPADEAKAPAVDNKMNTDMLALDGVGDNYVTFCNRIYEVTSRTTIRNERGTAITLENLTIPCEAMVSYYRKKGQHDRYVAVAIEVRGEAEPVPE